MTKPKKPAEPKPLLLGFCNAGMPEESHRRCRGSWNGRLCACAAVFDGRACHAPAPTSLEEAATVNEVHTEPTPQAVTIAEPGVLTISADDYHAHPALSSTGARKLLPPSCPAVFKYERDHGQPHRDTFDLGHAAHTLALGVGADIVALPFEDRRTGAFKAARDEAYADGKVPLLQRDYDAVQAMAAALREHPVVTRLLDPEAGAPEQSLFWVDADTDVACRARLDWLPHPQASGRVIAWDYKTAVSAAPDKFERAIDDHGYHQQADWYLDGMRALGLAGDDAVFLFVVQEKTPPYVVTIAQLDVMALKIAHARNQRAREIYRQCLDTDHWPPYAEETVLAALPIYAENRDIQEYAL